MPKILRKMTYLLTYIGVDSIHNRYNCDNEYDRYKFTRFAEAAASLFVGRHEYGASCKMC